jgi:hypothetical protein
MSILVERVTTDGYIVFSSETLKLGQLLKFSPSNKIGAVVVYTDNKSYLVNCIEPSIGDKQAEVHDWWSLKQPPSAALCLSPLFFKEEQGATALLNVNVYSSYETDEGRLGWDLWFRPIDAVPWVHVLKGNDLEHQNRALYSKEDCLWAPGLYFFTATLFYKSNLVPLVANINYQWKLEQESSSLHTDLYI